jgi:hypothetical protein
MCHCLHVCMYVCMCLCMHLWRYVCMCLCIHVFTYVCVCVYACMCKCMCIYLSIYVFIYAFMHMCMSLCMYACMCSCMYVCMCVCGRRRSLTYNQEILSCWGKTTLHHYFCLQLSSQTSINEPKTSSVWSHLGTPRKFQTSHYKHLAFFRIWVINDNCLFGVAVCSC